MTDQQLRKYWKERKEMEGASAPTVKQLQKQIQQEIQELALLFNEQIILQEQQYDVLPVFVVYLC